MAKKIVSRYEIIKALIKKEYKSVRPTAEQIVSVIRKYDLQRHTTDGKRRSREMMSRAMAKALNSLK